MVLVLVVRWPSRVKVIERSAVERWSAAANDGGDTLRRAVATARIIAGEIGFSTEAIATDRRIYEASISDLAAVSRELDDDWSHVVLFGHNPGFTDFANTLADCGMVDIECDIASWKEVSENCGRLREFDYPKNE